MGRLAEIIRANDARYRVAKAAGVSLERPAWLASAAEPWPLEPPKPRSSKPAEQPDPGSESL